MKTLARLALIFLAACGSDARLVQTVEPDRPQQPQPTEPTATAAPIGLERQAAPEPWRDPNTTTMPSCSPDGWCREAIGLTTRHLRAVFARTATEVYAVGDYGTLLIYDGTTWRKAPGGGPADDLFAVWASGPNDVWVAGIIGDPDQPQGMYAHFDGTAFDHIYKPLAKRPEAIFGFNSTDVWSVCSGGEIRRFTSNWYPTTPNVTSEALADVSGTGGHLFAAGANGTLLHHDGTSWTSTSLPGVGGFAAVLAFSPTKAFAAGGNEWAEYDGTRWTSSRWPLALDVELLGFWGASPNRMWGVGVWGKAWKFENGVGTKSDTGVGAILRDIHGVDEQHVWAVGFDGTVLRRYGP